jgi:hypothetical protein
MRVCTNAPDVQHYQWFHNRLLKDAGTSTPASPRMGGVRSTSPDLNTAVGEDIDVENEEDAAFVNDQTAFEMTAFPKYKIKLTDIEVEWKEVKSGDMHDIEVEWKKATARMHAASSSVSGELGKPRRGSDTQDVMTMQKGLATSEPEVATLNSSLETMPVSKNSESSEDTVLLAAFPVPSEDVFSDERKAHELQSSFGGSKLKISKRVEWFLMPLPSDGLKLKAFAPAASHLHVLLRIENSKHSGQTVVPLADAATAHAAKNGPK